MLSSVVCFYKHVRAHSLWKEKKMPPVIYLGCPGLKRLHVAPSNSPSKMHFNGVLKAQRPLPAPFPKSTAVLSCGRRFHKVNEMSIFYQNHVLPVSPYHCQTSPPHCPPRGIKTSSTTTSSSSSSAPPIRTHNPPRPPLPNHDPVWQGDKGVSEDHCEYHRERGKMLCLPHSSPFQEELTLG